MIYKYSPDEILESCIELATLLIGSKGQKALSVHKKELLTTLLWKVTERFGKYSPPWISEAGLKVEDKRVLQHERINTRKQLISKLLEGVPVRGVFMEAEACLVTEEEHAALSKFDKTHVGRERYAQAKIELFKNPKHKG